MVQVSLHFARFFIRVSVDFGSMRRWVGAPNRITSESQNGNKYFTLQFYTHIYAGCNVASRWVILRFKLDSSNDSNGLRNEGKGERVVKFI